MAPHAPLQLTERDDRADWGPLIGLNTGAGLRHVDEAAGQVDPVGHNYLHRRFAWHNTAVPAVFRQTQNVAIGEPSQLRGELVALTGRRRDRHGKAVLKATGD